MSFTKEKFAEMMRLQDQMNSVVNPDWRTSGYKWTDAILVESVEAIEHYGWKWWKKQNPDIDQVKMELVDIIHFAMSHAMVLAEPHIGKDVDALTNELWGLLEFLMEEKNMDEIRSHGLDFIAFMRGMAGLAASENFDIAYLIGAMDSIGMTFEELYEMYIAKNALNLFRQANGYRDGTYIKDWSKVGYSEDNGYLVVALDGYKQTSQEVPLFEYLNEMLTSTYELVK